MIKIYTEKIFSTGRFGNIRRGKKYIELDVDCHQFMTGKYGLTFWSHIIETQERRTLRDYLRNIIFDIGLFVDLKKYKQDGKLLTRCRIAYLDLQHAPELPVEIPAVGSLVIGVNNAGSSLSHIVTPLQIPALKKKKTVLESVEMLNGTQPDTQRPQEPTTMMGKTKTNEERLIFHYLKKDLDLPATHSIEHDECSNAHRAWAWSDETPNNCYSDSTGIIYSIIVTTLHYL